MTARCPGARISWDAAAELLVVRTNELTLDGVKPSVDQLVARLVAFWLPDEVVLCIGVASTAVAWPLVR